MKASELRIGNLIYIDSPDNNHTRILKIETGAQIDQVKYILHSPIPLTEEILLKAGFEKDNSGYELDHPDYCEWLQKEFPIIGELCQSSDKSYLFDTETDTLRIKYLHELQNLYHALKHEELEIKI